MFSNSVVDDKLATCECRRWGARGGEGQALRMLLIRDLRVQPSKLQSILRRARPFRALAVPTNGRCDSTSIIIGWRTTFLSHVKT